MRKLLSRLSGLPVLDLIGLILVGVWIVWAATTGALHGRLLSPLSPYVVAPVMVALGVAAGRQLADRFALEWLDDPRPGAIALAGVSTFLVWELWQDGPNGGPLGYANANAALAVQGLALLALALVSMGRASRRLLVLALLGLTATTVLIGSRAGLLVTVPVMATVLLALVVRLHSLWWTSAAIVVGAGAAGAAGASNVWLATRAQWPVWAEIVFDSTRRQLWSDAFHLWQRHPVVGAGPGSFREFSTLAADPDTATAHSSLLQVAAETGAIGGLLFAALVAMGYALAAQGPARRGVIGVAGWSALAIHSFVDHLLEFSLVVLAAGLVVGWAGRRTSEEFDVGESEGPLPR